MIVLFISQFNRNARMNALQKCCPSKESILDLSKRQLENLLQHIIVDRKNKLLYCYIPKVASSNMKRLILTLQNYTDDSNAIKYFDQRGFEFLSDVPTKERGEILKAFFKFLFVRNPLDRILSAYRNKFEKYNTQFQVRHGREIVRRYRSPRFLETANVKGNDVTFQEFARYLIDKGNAFEDMNEHWMPMYELCQPCYIKYDFVGSFEHLGLDTTALLAKLRALRAIKFPRKQSAYGRPLDENEIARYYRNLTADEYSELHSRYINDFKCFSYKFFASLRNVPNLPKQM